jgi:hypothetical protein
MDEATRNMLGLDENLKEKSEITLRSLIEKFRSEKLGEIYFKAEQTLNCK